MTAVAHRGARRLLALLLLIAVLPVSCLRESRQFPDHRQRISVTPLPLPPQALSAPHLGPFRLEGLWRIASRNPMFGGYSTMQRLSDGQFLAISDRGHALRLSPPGGPPAGVRMLDLVSGARRSKKERDAESSAYDPATGRIWIGWEGSNSISQHGGDLRRHASVTPPAMRNWSLNGGAEAMVRLADGRFLVLAESFISRFEDRRHEALVFPGDPTEDGQPLRMTFSGPSRFSPTDMAQLPDGRVLILMRRAVWPLPFRFVGRIALADPAEIRAGEVWRARTVAYLSSSLPVDNFEGIVAERQADGTVAVWIMSDDNMAATQRTLLWKMTVDPAKLR